MRRGRIPVPVRPRLRREHRASGAYALLVAAFALAPTGARSQDASGPPATEGPAGSPGTAAAGPLPAWIAQGGCDGPGDRVADLEGLVAGGTADRPPERPVYASRSEVDNALAELTGTSRVLLAGGNPSDPGSAVACGSLDAQAQGAGDLAIALDPLNTSGYQGTAQLHEADGRVTVVVVLVAPTADERGEDRTAPGSSPSAGASGEPTAIPSATAGAGSSPSAAGSPAASPQTSGDQAGGSGSGRAITSPIPLPSVRPGTSGAPPFSPLPQATSAT